jgi:N-ethylmaleimide reductase
LFPRVLIVASGHDFESGTAAVESKRANLIAFARPFVANPDLITRWRKSQQLARLNRDTLYTPGPVGYIDYPSADHAAHTDAK